MTLDKFCPALFCLLAFSLPFEFDRPLLNIGPIAFTNLELIALACIAVTVPRWSLVNKRVPHIWLLLLTLFLVSGIVSGLLAAPLQLNALKAIARTAVGVMLMIAAAVAFDSRRDVMLVIGGYVIGGAIALGIGSAEILLNTPFDWLRPLRESPSLAGPFLRLSGTFDYTNQAAIFAETALFLAVLLALTTRIKASFLLTLFIINIASILTFSRAALLTVLVTFMLVIAVAYWKNRTAKPWLIGLGVFFASLAMLIVSNQVLRLRLQTVSEQVWYQAKLETEASITIPAGSKMNVALSVHNLSPRSWSPNALFPIRIGARWIDLSRSKAIAEPRWSLETTLRPDEQRHYDLMLQAPLEPGRYELRWDLVEEQIAWFEQMNGQQTVTSVEVTAAGELDASAEFPLSTSPNAARATFRPPDPNRLVLWRVGYQLWRGSPLFGIGLDNYRFLYGPELGLSTWNETLHSNNWYVETLVSFGIVGGTLFLLWLGLLVWDFGQKLILPHSDTHNFSLRITIAACLVAYLIHGLLDYFLIFNSTGFAFWLLVGLWLTVRSDRTEEQVL